MAELTFSTHFETLLNNYPVFARNDLDIGNAVRSHGHEIYAKAISPAEKLSKFADRSVSIFSCSDENLTALTKHTAVSPVLWAGNYIDRYTYHYAAVHSYSRALRYELYGRHAKEVTLATLKDMRNFIDACKTCMPNISKIKNLAAQREQAYSLRNGL